MRIWILLFTLMRIRILPFTLIRVRILPVPFNLMRIRIVPIIFPDLDPPMIQNGPLRLPPFHFNADPDPAFHFDAGPGSAFYFNADPDTASQNDADPQQWILRIRNTALQNFLKIPVEHQLNIFKHTLLLFYHSTFIVSL